MKVDKFIFPADFITPDMVKDKEVPHTRKTFLSNRADPD